MLLILFLAIRLVEAEHAFSALHYIAIKIRNYLIDNTLNGTAHFEIKVVKFQKLHSFFLFDTIVHFVITHCKH